MPSKTDNTDEALSQRIIALEEENKRLKATVRKLERREVKRRSLLESIAGSLTSARNTVQSEAEQLWRVTGAISAHQETIAKTLAAYEKADTE